MAKQSAAYRLGQAMAKRAQGIGNVGAVGPSQAAPQLGVMSGAGGRPSLEVTNPVGGANASAPLASAAPTQTQPAKAPGIYTGGQRVNTPAQKPSGGLRVGSAVPGQAGGAPGLETGTGIYQGGSEVAAQPTKAPGIYMGGKQASFAYQLGVALAKKAQGVLGPGRDTAAWCTFPRRR